MAEPAERLGAVDGDGDGLDLDLGMGGMDMDFEVGVQELRADVGLDLEDNADELASLDLAVEQGVAALLPRAARKSEGGRGRWLVVRDWQQ